MKKNKNTLISGIILLVMIAMIIFLFVELFPLLKEVVVHVDNEEEMISIIKDYGFKGALILAGLQALQVILAVIPAAAVQILAGLCYGVGYGTIICVLGYLVGNLLVFFALRQFSSTFESFFRPKKKKKPNSWINAEKIKDMKHPEFLALLLYFIPAIPNGILPYIFAQTKITVPKYIISMVAGCVPSVLMGTLFGQFLAQKEYVAALILIVLIVVIVVLLFAFREKIIAKFEKLGQ